MLTQIRDHLFILFIRNRRENYHILLVLPLLQHLNAGDKRLHRTRIMSAVQDQMGRCLFHPSGPMYLCQRFCPAFMTFPRSLRPVLSFFSKQILRRLQRNLRIHGLITPTDGDPVDNIFIIRIRPGKCNIFPVNFSDFERIFRDFSTPASSFLSHLSDDSGCLRA